MKTEYKIATADKHGNTIEVSEATYSLHAGQRAIELLLLYGNTNNNYHLIRTV